MRLLVSAIIQFFLSPFNWILFLAIAAFLFRKPGLRKICRIAALCLLVIFTNPMLLHVATVKWQAPRTLTDSSEKYSCGIVLGGFASIDAEDHPYFNGACDRFIQTLKLYKTGHISHILISGGNGTNTDKKSFTEAGFVRNELLLMGVPDSAIIVEDKSITTKENAVFSKIILATKNLPPPYLLITSSMHIPRATLLFNQSGIATVPYTCNYVAVIRDASLGFFIPQPEVLANWEGYFKEVFGYAWYKWKG